MAVSTIHAHLTGSGATLVGQAKSALMGSGILIVRGAVERQAAEVANQAVVTELCSDDAGEAKRHGIRVGDGRYMVTLDLNPPFDKPELLLSPTLARVWAQPDCLRRPKLPLGAAICLGDTWDATVLQICIAGKAEALIRESKHLQ